jgi:hypothetical protein
MCRIVAATVAAAAACASAAYLLHSMIMSAVRNGSREAL